MNFRAEKATKMKMYKHFWHFSFYLMWDEVAEWLRRWTANPLCSARVGSNPILVEFFFFFLKITSESIICLDSFSLTRQLVSRHLFFKAAHVTISWLDADCCLALSLSALLKRENTTALVIKYIQKWATINRCPKHFVNAFLNLWKKEFWRLVRRLKTR